MSGCVVMVKKPIVFCPLVWRFVPNALIQPLQNLTVKLPTDGLTGEYQFLVDNALDVEKNHQHYLDIAAILTRFSAAVKFGEFHCDDCCLVSGSQPYTRVPSPVMILEIKLGSSLACCLSSLQTEMRWAFRSSLSSLGTNLAEMRLMF